MSGGVEVTWNGVSSTTIPELVFTNPTRQLLGSHRGSFLEIPGRLGSWYYKNLRGRRQITIEGFVQSTTFDGRRNAITALADWLDVDLEAKLILGDDPTVYYEAVLTDTGDTAEWRDVGTFILTWECNPYSFDLSTSSSVHNVDQDQTDIFSLGNLTVMAPVITITPTNGDITAFDLTLNDDALQWSGGTIISGGSLTINSISSVVTTGVNTDIELTGAYVVGNLSMSFVYGAFPFLIPGNNTLVYHQLSGSATAITITIYYRKAYRK